MTTKREQIYRGLENARVVYVNSVQVAQTAFDLRFWFGLLEEADEARIVSKVDTVMFMSPQHAKVFAAVLNKHIQKYESLHGYISAPDLPAADAEEEA